MGGCKDPLRLNPVPAPGGEEVAYFARLVETVIRAVERGQIPRAQYGAILIDEGHDFEPAWLLYVAMTRAALGARSPRITAGPRYRDANVRQRTEHPAE